MKLDAISGSSLMELSKSPDFQLLLRTQIAKNPEIALQQISSIYGSLPEISGSLNRGIVYIRDLLYERLGSLNIPAFFAAFAIVAPHTHWESDELITYFFDKSNSRYVIGPHEIKIQNTYYPVSFCFLDNVTIPYEWVSAELINSEHLPQLYNVIDQLALQIAKNAPGFGLSLDFRFKANVIDPSVNTVELPIDDDNDDFDGFSEIIKEDLHLTQLDGEGLEQVAWGAQSDLALNLTAVELQLLYDVRNYMRLFQKPNTKETLSQLFSGT